MSHLLMSFLFSGCMTIIGYWSLVSIEICFCCYLHTFYSFIRSCCPLVFLWISLYNCSFVAICNFLYLVLPASMLVDFRLWPIQFHFVFLNLGPVPDTGHGQFLSVLAILSGWCMLRIFLNHLSIKTCSCYYCGLCNYASITRRKGYIR